MTNFLNHSSGNYTNIHKEIENDHRNHHVASKLLDGLTLHEIGQHEKQVAKSADTELVKYLQLVECGLFEGLYTYQVNGTDQAQKLVDHYLNGWPLVQLNRSQDQYQASRCEYDVEHSGSLAISPDVLGHRSEPRVEPLGVQFVKLEQNQESDEKREEYGEGTEHLSENRR